MKKITDRKKSGKAKGTPKNKKGKEIGKAKIPVISHYYPEELPKR
jgi:hypothetical protein